MTSENFFGSVNNQWKKAKLEELAQAFALAPRPRTVAQLVHDINAHMDEHPERITRGVHIQHVHSTPKLQSILMRG